MKNHLKSQAEYLRDKGMKVVLISSYGPEIHQINLDNDLIYEEIEISRQIHPVKDLLTLIKIIRAFREQRFDIVHSTTPKAGLLSSVAAFITGVPVRIHTWTGQPWVTLTGLKKLVTMSADMLIGLLSTKCYADSPSQREFLIQKRIIHHRKIKVISKGSISGIDLERFHPGRFTGAQKTTIKVDLGLSKSSEIVTFIGRINKDKGIFELISAFIKIINQGYDTDLLIIGPLDQNSEGQGFVNMKEYIKDYPRIHYLGYHKNPEKYLSITDIFCLPSYREGFGTTVIEAASMGIPAIGTKINGLVDAIIDGETGLLVPLKSVSGLVAGLKRLLDNPQEREEMGYQARLRCIQNFDKNIINELMRKEYLNLLESKQNQKTNQ